MIAHAIRCLNQGFAIFPLKPNTKLPATTHGFKDASKSLEQVNRWWADMPDANIGIATGIVSGVAVVDVDCKKGAIGKESVKLIRGLLPYTLKVSTPSGGWHLYYKIEKPVPSRSQSTFIFNQSGIDFKSEKGYVVGAGSKIDSKTYLSNSHGIANISAILVSMALRNSHNQCPNPTAAKGSPIDTSITVSDGNWHFPVLRLVARMVKRGYLDSEIFAVTDGLTLNGYALADTRREVSVMITGARKKGFNRTIG